MMLYVKVKQTCFLTDQFEKVKRFHQESLRAEEKCNSSVSGPLSPVETSKETRVLTEDLLDASKDTFLRTVAAHNKSLNELQHKGHDLEKKVHQLSHKVGEGVLHSSAGWRTVSFPQSEKINILLFFLTFFDILYYVFLFI